MAFSESRILTTQQLIEQIRESNRNGERFCFILGSGASVESGIPSGNSLEMQWMDCLMGKSEDRGTPPKDPAVTEKVAGVLHKDKKLSHSFDKIKEAWENAKREERSISSEYYFDIYKLRFYPNKRNGYRYMEKLMEPCEPSIGYHTLALMLTEGNQNNLVITTNFDSLVEDALFLYTTKKPLVVSHESLAGYIESDIQRPIVAKVHRGLMYEPFNSPDTTDKLQEEWRETLNYAFNTYTPIVVGYGGGDHSLMDYLKDEKTTLRHGIYWCCRKADGLPEQEILDFLEAKDGYLVEIGGFDALMLKLGKAIFPDTIAPAAARAILQNQCDRRIQKYQEQWRKQEENPDVQEIVQSINLEEEQAEEQREQENALTIWDYRNRGWRALDDGDYHKAVEAYTKVIELRGNYDSDYGNRANAYIHLEEYEKALADCDRAIELNPRGSVAYNNRGYVRESLGQHEKAIADYTQAISLDPKEVVVYCNRGDAYENLGQHAMAIADYTQAISLDPKNAVAYNNRSYTYNNLGEYEKALADCNKVIELDPEFANSYRHRGNAYAGLKEYQKALDDLTEAIRLYPKYKEAYLDRAKVYRALGEEALARADEEQAAKL